MWNMACCMTITGRHRMANELQDKEQIAGKAKALADAILAFRDAANAREDFVKYKILVGFESVYPGHWQDQQYDYSAADRYRQEAAAQYIADIDPSNADGWFNFLTRCAETKSNDLATFPVFGQFLVNLAKAKPEIAENMLARAGEDLRRFTPAFLNGLAISERGDIYDRVLQQELAKASNLSGLARHLRYSGVRLPAVARQVLDKALEQKDDLAVIESLLFCMEHFGTGQVEDEERFFADAMTYLTERNDSRWVGETWFLYGDKSKFFDALTAERSALILDNLSNILKINHQVERILVGIAESRPEDVWDYFGGRVQRERSEVGSQFDAVPFSFHGLEKEFSKNPELAIRKGRTWYAGDKQLFQFRGGRLISNSFPDCSPAFAESLVQAIEVGSGDDADFALAVLQNYRGESTTHPVLKAIVAKYPDDAGKMSRVRAALDSTGVVHGELGFAEAYRNKKEALRDWLSDERPSVKAFAADHASELDNMIASETRRAEDDSAMRRLRFSQHEPTDSDEIE